MATRFITLKKSDPAFLQYLWGRHADFLNGKIRAIPVKTYNLGTDEESVTFELQKTSDIARPSFFVLGASLIKLNIFILLLFPLFYVLVKNYVINGIEDPLSLTLAAGASILLFAGMNIRNDINDHISGFDRVNTDWAKKPLSRGWVTAHQASRISLALMFLSALIALPVLLIHMKLLWIIGCSALLVFMGKLMKINSYKHQHFGELALFVLIGPALVSGYQLSAGAQVSAEIMAFGILWGLFVVYLVQVNNFTHIMTSSLSGIRNSMTKLGFDKAQRFLIWFWLTLIVLWFYFHCIYANSFWAIGGALVLLFSSIPLYKKILNIKSPMGSGLVQIRQQAHKAFLVMLLVFISENLWLLWGESF